MSATQDGMRLASSGMGTPHVQVLAERCAGCEECIIRCPPGALSIDPEKWIAVAEDALCVGCRQCERTCPFSAIRVEGPMVVAPRQPALAPVESDLMLSTTELHQGWRGFDQAAVEAQRCLLCPDPTCMEGCPAHNDIPGFIRAIRDGDLEEAQAVLRRTTVLPDVCSRVCDTSVQCEGACSWTLAGGEPVAIAQLERFVTEQRALGGVERTGSAGDGLLVCVVGSGPAGIAAAWELLAEGAKVTMLERDAEAGGVPRWGIPAFALPDAVKQRPVQALIDAGLELRTNCALGQDVTLPELLARHDAVVLAHGASKPMIPPIEGADLGGVEHSTTFLKRAKDALRDGELLPEYGTGRHVLVLGGGNSAMDVARTVRRLGGEATCVEWMDERFARVRPDELEQARTEGVRVHFTTTVERLEGGADGVRTAWLRRTKQPRVDQLPQLLSGAAEALAVDRVVFALGYRVETPSSAEEIKIPLALGEPRNTLLDRRWLASGIMASPRSQVGWLALRREAGLAVSSSPHETGWWTRLREGRGRSNPEDSARTKLWTWRWRRRAASGLAAAPRQQAERVWVAGDALVGPSTVVGSMAQGKSAARAILDTLGTHTDSTDGG
jgi:glutamate synthase (NADPH/NADH) small chain